MPPPHTRRVFLLSTLGTGFTVAAAAQDSLRISRSDTTMTTLQAIVDTLIPTDSQSGALDIGLESRLRDYAKRNPDWPANLSRLVAATDALAFKAHGRSFKALGLDERERLLEPVLRGQADVRHMSDLRLCFGLIKRWYYSSAAGNAVLGYLPPSKYPTYSGPRRK